MSRESLRVCKLSAEVIVERETPNSPTAATNIMSVMTRSCGEGCDERLHLPGCSSSSFPPIGTLRKDTKDRHMELRADFCATTSDGKVALWLPGWIETVKDTQAVNRDPQRRAKDLTYPRSNGTIMARGRAVAAFAAHCGQVLL